MSYKTETRSNPSKRTKRKPKSIKSREQSPVPNIKDVEIKISHLRENLKIAAAKCRDDIRKEQNSRQTTYGGAMARLNLWKRLQNPTEEKRKIGDRNMDHAINVLSSLSKLRSTARQMEVASVCAESPRTLRLTASKSLYGQREKRSTPSSPQAGSLSKPSKESTRETAIKVKLPDRFRSIPDRCRSECSSPRYRNVVTQNYPTVGYTPNNYQIENRGYSTYTPVNDVPVSPSYSTHSAPTRMVTYTQQPVESKWVAVSSLAPDVSRSYDLPGYGHRNQGSTQHVLSRIRSWPVLDSDDFLDY